MQALTRKMKWGFCCGLWLAMAVSASAAILVLEDFSGGANGWGDRDAGEMSVSHYSSMSDNWMVGSYGVSFLPQSDAFRISSGTDFTGSYAGRTQISFDLYAVNVLPSDLLIRLIDGANVFTYQFTPTQSAGIGFETFTVDLAWSYGWNGLSEPGFIAALTSIDAVEIQISRGGSLAQSYYLDNVQILDTPISGGGGDPSAVPEPKTMSIFLIVGIMALAVNRKFLRKIQTA